MKTAELDTDALNWAVMKCEFKRMQENGEPVKQWVIDRHSAGKYAQDYSTDWSQGGPIIEREGISIRKEPDGGWYAVNSGENFRNSRCCPPNMSDGGGDTPLIAAMRCYVTSKLGEEVEIPEVLR